MNSAKHNNGPIFIVGAPRSGTTLLQYMLRSHPRLSLPTGESHFFIPLYRNADKYGDLSQLENVRAVLDAMYRQSADFLDSDLHGMKFDVASLAEELHREGRSSMSAIIAGLFEKNAHGEGKVRWGDKTPYYVLHLPKIMEWFPDAQIIHMIRDGRDCALSMAGRKHDFRVYNTYLAAKYWQQYVEVGQAEGRKLGGNVYFELRYCDLLAEPEKMMRSVCAFLGEEYSDSLVYFQKATDPNAKTPLLKKELQSDNRYKWKSLMSRDQIRVFESAAGDTLQHCGYKVISDCRPLPLALRGGYRLHNKLVTSWWDFTKRFTKAR